MCTSACSMCNIITMHISKYTHTSTCMSLYISIHTDLDTYTSECTFEYFMCDIVCENV